MYLDGPKSLPPTFFELANSECIDLGTSLFENVML